MSSCGQLKYSGTKESFKTRFYGVYLLCSQSLDKSFKGKCYVGFTVNPNRRINQHNRGKDFGGAKKTSNKGPWKMVMIVHGFPNNISALQFEWAWQQPALSSRLKCFPELKRKMPKETYFQYNFRILSRMLNVGPWQRLPLIVHWLEIEYECGFDSLLAPPKHMKIVNGCLSDGSHYNKIQQSILPRTIWALECHLCMKIIEKPEQSSVGCLNSICKLTCHIICLANHLLASDNSQKGQYIPIVGECPLCETSLLWVEILQKKRRFQTTEDDDDDIYVDSDEDQEFINFDNKITFSQELHQSTEPIDVLELSD